MRGTLAFVQASAGDVRTYTFENNVRALARTPTVYDVLMAEWQSLGKHRVRVDEDVVHAVWQGEVELADAQQLFALYAGVKAQRGRLFCLSDMRGSGVPSAAVRRWMADFMRHRLTIDAAAAYGANGLIRAAFIMLLRGVMLLGKFRFPFELFATEAEARAWLDRLRAGHTHGGH